MITAGNTSSANGKIVVSEYQKVITVTKKTVRYGLEVYQTNNIAGFGEGEIDRVGIPWPIIFILFLIGIALLFYSWFRRLSTYGDTSLSEALSLFSYCIFAFSIGLAIWNLVKPKYYGFLITLNSGDRRLFTTLDRKGLKQVITTIYDFIEAEQEGAYQITVSNSSIQGNLIQGSNFRDYLESK